MADLTNEPVATIVTNPEPGAPAVIALHGELDISNADAARRVVDGLLAERNDRVVFEMSDLSFMDSSGIAVLVYAANRADAVELRHPSSMIRRTIEITGLSETFAIAP